MKFGTLRQILNGLQARDQKLKFLEFKMLSTAILKIAFLAITHRPIVRFRRNFVRGSRTACRQRPHDKNCIFLIQDGGRPPFWKSLYRHISVKNCPTLMKFGTLHQILIPIAVTWSKIEFFKVRDGDGRHLENRKITISEWKHCCIFTKVGVLQHVLNLMRFSEALSQNLRCDKVTINE